MHINTNSISIWESVNLGWVSEFLISKIESQEWPTLLIFSCQNCLTFFPFNYLFLPLKCLWFPQEAFFNLKSFFFLCIILYKPSLLERKRDFNVSDIAYTQNKSDRVKCWYKITLSLAIRIWRVLVKISSLVQKIQFFFKQSPLYVYLEF